MMQHGDADTASFNVMIGGLAEDGQIKEAIALLEEGAARGLRWDDRTFCKLLVACGQQGDLAAGKRAHQMALAHKGR